MEGARCPSGAIRHLLGDHAVRPEVLVDQFLLRPRGDELVFSHALIRDGAYGSLLLAPRVGNFTALAAAWIEGATWPGRRTPGSDAEDDAAAAYLRAARVLQQRFEFAAALALVEPGPASGWRSPAASVELRLARSQLLVELGQPYGGWRRRQGASRWRPDEIDRAPAWSPQAAACRLLDRVPDGLNLLERAQPADRRAGLLGERAACTTCAATCCSRSAARANAGRAHELARNWRRAARRHRGRGGGAGGVTDAAYAAGPRAQRSRAVLALRRDGACAGLPARGTSYKTMVAWCALYLLDLPGALRAAPRRSRWPVAPPTGACS